MLFSFACALVSRRSAADQCHPYDTDFCQGALFASARIIMRSTNLYKATSMSQLDHANGKLYEAACLEIHLSGCALPVLFAVAEADFYSDWAAALRRAACPPACWKRVYAHAQPCLWKNKEKPGKEGYACCGLVVWRCARFDREGAPNRARACTNRARACTNKGLRWGEAGAWACLTINFYFCSGFAC